jgi:hypothetical protein
MISLNKGEKRDSVWQNGPIKNNFIKEQGRLSIF